METTGEWGRQFQICVDVVRGGGGGDSIGVMKLRALGLLQREAMRRRRSPSPFILRLYTNALRRVGVKLLSPTPVAAGRVGKLGRPNSLESWLGSTSRDEFSPYPHIPNASSLQLRCVSWPCLSTET